MTDKKNTSAANYFESMKSFASVPGFDMEYSMNLYRKNMEALAQLQKATLDMVRDISKLNSDFSRQLLEETREHMKALSHAKSFEERSQMSVDKMKSNIERIMEHNKQITNLWSKSCNDMGEKIQGSMQEQMKRMQEMAPPKAKRH